MTTDFIIHFHQGREANKDKMPYQFDLIDLVNDGYKINENAHTRVLAAALSYRKRGVYPLLTSFINLINRHCDASPLVLPKMAKPTISTQFYVNTDGTRGFIDTLIYEPKRYAVIIENKVENAAAQDQQIDRYVVSMVRDYDIPAERVYVVYTIRDENSYVPEVEVTEAKEILGMSDKSRGRFAVLTYKEHLLAWFEEVARFIPDDEMQLSYGIQQYVDHLKGMFNLKEDARKMDNTLIETIAEKLGINLAPQNREEYDKLRQLVEEIGSVREGLQEKMDKAYACGTWNVEERIPMSLAELLKKHYEAEDHVQELFGRIWIYQSCTCVLERQEKPSTVIDCNCEKFGKIHISLFSRNASIDERFGATGLNALTTKTALRVDERRERLCFTHEYEPQVDVNDIDLDAFYKKVEEIFSVLKELKEQGELQKFSSL